MVKERFVSLKIKMFIAVMFICSLVGVLAILSVNWIATSIIDKEYSEKAEQISEALIYTLDPEDVKELTDTVMNIYTGIENPVPSTEWGSEEWEAYMSNYEGIDELPVFIKLRDHFRVFQDIYMVDCFYLMSINPEAGYAVYIVDSAPEEDACPPGVVDCYEDGAWPDEEDNIVHATITNEEAYGWLVSAGYPVMYDGEVIAHLCVDVSMDDIKAKERSYVITATLIMIGLTILLLIIALGYVRRNVISPITALSDTAKNYCSENNDVVHHAFERLQFNTRDEITQLLASMKQMEADMNTNINTLIDTKVALKETEEKASTMQALAVKDALTGVRNKTAYDHEVKKMESELESGQIEFGIAMVDLNFLKKTNDTYGHEKGNISIKNLCALVCGIFEHSPVFRIGGDEFVVILRNRDYQSVDQLMAEFNDRLSSLQKDSTLQPWEKISAAIGFAGFDGAEDKTVEDVFKKADKAMYERKVAMKAERRD